MDKYYGGVIWTNHAMQRLQERNIKQSDAWATWKRPQLSRYAKTKDAYVYYRTYNNRKLEVVAKQNEQKEWLILTVWDKEVYGNNYEKKQSSLLTKLLKKLFKK